MTLRSRRFVYTTRHHQTTAVSPAHDKPHPPTQAELFKLHAKFRELAELQGDPNTITADEFAQAMQAIGILENDTKLLTTIFGMMDKTEDGQVRCNLRYTPSHTLIYTLS